MECGFLSLNKAGSACRPCLFLWKGCSKLPFFSRGTKVLQPFLRDLLKDVKGNLQNVITQQFKLD